MGARARSVAVAVLLVATGCGGGTDDAPAGSEPPVDEASAADTASAEPGTTSDAADAADDEEVASSGTEVDDPPADELSGEGPELRPTWQITELGEVNVGSDASVSVVGDTVWLTADRWNSSLVARSDDDGVSFAPVMVEAAPTAASAFDRSTIDGVVGDGALLVGWGSRATGCTSIDVEGGRRTADFCRNHRAVIHRSTDGGETWQQLEPDAMAPRGDENVVIRDMAFHLGVFVAVGGVQGPDWHGRIWVSADGESWSLAQEIRSPVGSTTATQVLSDGTDLLVRWHEHTCAVNPIHPSDTTAPSWVLGTSWPSDVRVLLGPTADDLVAVDNAVVSLLPEPRDVDCATADIFDLAQIPQPNVMIGVVDADFVMVDASPALADVVTEDDDGDWFGPLRWATHGENGWRVETLADAPASSDGFSLDRFSITDLDGQLALVDARGTPAGRTTRHPRVVVVHEAGAEEVRLTPVPSGTLLATTFVGTTELVAWRPPSIPDANGTVFSSDAVPLAVGRLAPDSPPVSCDLVAGGSCRFARLADHPAYPDFAGLDLTGVDLRYTDLGDADFSGVVFDDASLVGASSSDADFSGASFVGADVRWAALHDVGGADLSAADLRSASLAFTVEPTLAGANLIDADLRLRFPFRVEPVTVEVSLRGLDLRNTTFAGAFDAPLLVITDLTDAVVNNRTRFSRVDLSSTELGEISIGDVSVDSNTICPPGFENSGSFAGNCVSTP